MGRKKHINATSLAQNLASQILFLHHPSTINMSANTPSAFNLLGKFPTEIRRMIFAYMVQDIIKSEHQRWKHNLVLGIAQLKSHLMNSPWILDKQYCAEYLRVFLKQVELRADITCEGFTHVMHQTQMSEVEDCLNIINLCLKRCDNQIDIKNPNDRYGTYMKGVCLSHDSTLYVTGYNMTQDSPRYIENSIKRPIKQLRRLYENFNIPADKISIHISYGDPNAAFWAFADQQLAFEEFYEYKTSLLPVQARIWVTDYDASIVAIDQELRVFKEALRERLNETRIRFPKPVTWYHDGVPELGARIEREIVKIREIHARIIEKVTKFWKARDEGHEADSMFEREFWTREHILSSRR